MTTPSPAQQEVTQLLGDWSSGDERALEKLIPLVQPELHRLAHHQMSRKQLAEIELNSYDCPFWENSQWKNTSTMPSKAEASGHEV